MPSKFSFWNHVFISLVVIMAFGTATACSSSAGDDEADAVEHDEEDTHEEDTHEETEHEEDNHEEVEHEEIEHEHEESGRIPNDGAAIHVLEPADGSAFSSGDDIVVEVEVLGFDLAAEGNHWHVYVDGTSHGMVTGGDTDKVLRGLETGDRLIEVFIAGGDHIEFEDGDKITITVQ